MAQGDVPFRRWLANGVADVFAKVVRDSAQLPDLVLQQVEEEEDMAFFICMRLAAIETLCWEFWHNSESLKCNVPGVKECISATSQAEIAAAKWAQTGHDILQVSAFSFKCQKCGTAAKSLRWSLWSQLPCQSGTGVTLASKELMVQHSPSVVQGTWRLAQQKTSAIVAENKKAVTAAVRSRHTIVSSQAAFRKHLRAHDAKVRAFAGPGDADWWTWFSRANPSHQLRTAGGALFCARCGALATGKRRQGMLFRECRKHCLAGSRYRLLQLVQGSAAATGWTVWPDDDDSSERKAVFKILSSRCHRAEHVAVVSRSAGADDSD